MGYETQISIVRRSQLAPDHFEKWNRDLSFAMKMVTFRLGNVGGKPDCFKKDADCFFYADDGDTPVIEDKYEEPLGMATIPEVLAWLEKRGEEDRETWEYWGLSVLYTTLVQLQDIFQNSPDIVVLHYGY